MRHLLIFCVCLACSAGGAQAESRKVYHAASPHWLAAIGKLSVPSQTWIDGYREHRTEHCSATLVSNKADGGARFILSAWHCLEYYGDLSMDIDFTLPELGLRRVARLVQSGGGMDADWAILKLDQPVSSAQVAALRIRGLPRQSLYSGAITMAGYSRDAGLGQGGNILTYDEHCQILSADRRLVTTDCSAFKGASGGPVVRHSGDEYHLLGVISVGDSDSRSMYVPAAAFASALRLHL